MSKQENCNNLSLDELNHIVFDHPKTVTGTILVPLLDAEIVESLDGSSSQTDQSSTSSEQSTTKVEELSKEQQQLRALSLRYEAIALVKAKSLLEELCLNVLDTKPSYSFGKFANVTSNYPRKYYTCQVVIKTNRTEFHDLEGVFSGTGQSKRIAQMAACKNALVKFQQATGESNCFEQFVVEQSQLDH